MTSGGSGRGQVAAAVAVALAVLSGGGVSSAQAAGLGRLTVQSALGQPLRAEVEVTAVTAEEADTLTAKIASPEAFSRVGLQYKEALSGVRMAVENRGGRYFIKVTSSKPINDPFVDLVVELSWASGTFSREYTFLLDPPVQHKANQSNRSGNAAVTGAATASQGTPAANSNAVRTIDPSTGKLVSQDRSNASGAAPKLPAEKQTPQGPAGRDAQSEGGVVTVGRGETLGMIAQRVRPASATLDQTIVAIYRTNPSAFIQNNPHLIRQGRELTIPSEGEIASIDGAEAGRQLRMAARDFRSYKERLAGVVPEVKTDTGSTSASGTVSAHVDDAQGEGAGSSDRLELSRSEGTKDGKGVGVRDAEAQVARDAALKEANSRIAELEKNVNSLKSMLELKDRSLADLQAQLERARAAGAQVSGTVGAAATAAADKARDAAGQVADEAAKAKAAAEKAAAEKAEQARAAAEKAAAETKAAAEKLAAEKKAAEEKLAAEKAAAEKVAAEKAAEEKAAAEKALADARAVTDNHDEQQQSADDKSVAERAAADAKAEVERVTSGDDLEKGKDTPQPAPVNDGEGGEDSLISGLSDNSMLLPGLGVAAVVAGLGFWMMRRRRREDDGFSDSISADEFTANSLFGTTGGQSVDTMTGASTQITTISEATPTEVDPIAEAEVYIAYGRETQAEEILREALKRQPERQAIRLKLLEIYSGRKDTVAFSQMAREMHEMTGGLNEEWPRVVSMGAALDPDNPLYGDGTSAAATQTDMTTVASGASTVGAAMSGAAGMAAGVAAAMTSSEHAAAQPAAEPTQDVAVQTLISDNTMEFDGGTTTQAAQPEASQAHASTFQASRSGPLSAMPSVELPSLDLDSPLDMDEGPSTVTDLNIDTTITESLDMGDHGQGDLGSIGLDLSPSTISGPITMSGAASSQWQEMASKLDLASAYVEIGDKEGARELLEEVLQGGDASQQQRARELLADL